MDRIHQAIQDARGYLETHPEEARYTDSGAVAELTDGLRVTTTGPADETVVTDMPPSVGGEGTAPSPGWLMRAAIASCTATLVAMRAAQVGVTLAHLRVRVTSESDDRGILGMAEVPAGPLSVRVVVSMEADGADQRQLETIARWGLDHCPVADAIERPVPVELIVEGTAN
jgi:uncharacterized OsmC-like protein